MVAENLLDPEELAKPHVDQLDLEKPVEDKVFDIQIDRAHYEVAQTRITGADLRNIPTPPIPLDRDLFEVIPGRPDRKVEASDRILVRDGLRFFTAPNTINPGSGLSRCRVKGCAL